MSFFIAAAHAQEAAPPAQANPMFTLLMFVGLFVFMYILLIRPQRKRQKEHQQLVNALSKGDEVLMTSGIVGKIARLDDNYVVLDVTDNVQLKFQRVAVHAVLPKGTIKAI